MFTIQITLQENKEDAAGLATPGRTSEYIRVATDLLDLHQCCIDQQLTPSQLQCTCLELLTLCISVFGIRGFCSNHA